MTAFAGIVSFHGTPDDFAGAERRLRGAIGSPNTRQSDVRRAEGALFVQRAADGRPHAAGSHAASLFMAHARLDNRAELGAALNIPPPELARTPDSALVLRMLERWGEAGIARCLGAFAFALWDPDQRRLILGRDCLGNRALFFHRGDGFVAFASTLGALLALPRVPRTLDELVLANFLAANLTDQRRTFYRGIERVPSRTLVTIDRNGIDHRHYWSPDLGAPPPFRRDADYIERARELFDQAVITATRDTPHVAISTSGGLDSSAIAATVARLGRAESIACFTIVPPAGTRIDIPHKYLDERDKVEALARMHPALNVHFCVEGTLHPFEEDNMRFFARANMPILGPGNLGAFSHLHDAVAAAHRTLLVGISGNFGLTWHGRFSVLALLRNREFATFAREFSLLARQDNRGLARTFLDEIVRPIWPHALRRLAHRMRGRDPDSVAWYSALNPAYVAEHDLVRHWQANEFYPRPQHDGWNAARHRARFLFDLNQVGRDYRAMSDDLRGFEVRDPHADRRLLEFLLTVPEPMYRRGGVPRSFARAVFADRLPREILGERRRGAQGVTWFRRLNAGRQDVAAELGRLDELPTARRLIDLPRLKRLVEQWPENENAAEIRRIEYCSVLNRGIHVGRFIRWVEGGNA